MKTLKKSILPLILLLGLTLFFKLRAGVLAQFSDSVAATIQISVCGNGIIEGGEDCERHDLNGLHCWDLGFWSGNLDCDIACSFDTSRCWGVAPTPTPTPTSTLTPTPTPTPTPTTTSTTSTTTTTDDGGGNQKQQQQQEKKVNLTAKEAEPEMPVKIVGYDADEDGKINRMEMVSALTVWTGSYQEVRKTTAEGKKPVSGGSCDLNNDGFCNLVDFSILMYYVER